ncbi:MAG: DUF4242 domain-containing protein [Chitinophagaceae bacterium]
MKVFFGTVLLTVLSIASFSLSAQPNRTETSIHAGEARNLFIDVHQLEPGKVKYEDVAKAHAKDLATEGKYGVHFIKYWVNEEKGLVYCLSSSSDSESIRKTHAEAHGLVPHVCYPVTDGMEAALKGKTNLFLDIHYLGAGKVSAKDVAEAHKKDLATQGKYGVSFINYWVNEKEGMVMCLSEAKDSTLIIKTHKEAHGLVPAKILKVKQGE